MIIDATDLIAGKIATYAAKKALLGEGIVIVNSEKAIISGKPSSVIMDVKKKYDRGTPSTGPFIPKRSDRFLKRIIRGMLPYKQPKGEKAFKRIKCYNGFPDNFKDQPVETIEMANLSNLPNVRYVRLAKLCQHLGGKE